MSLFLQRMMQDVPVDRFMADHYLKRPFVGRGAAVEVRRLANWGVVERLIERTSCDLLLARDGAAWTGPRVTKLAEARAAFDQGFTLALRHAERFDPELAELGRTLAAELQGTINLQVYCTPAEHGSFGWHCDPEEVFIFQTEGAKEYAVRENTVNPLPLLETLHAASMDSEERTEAEVIRLEAGDWLYLPGGFWHSTRAEEASISISVGVMPPTPIDMLDFVRHGLLRDVKWRRRLSPLGRASPMSDEEKIALCREAAQELATLLQSQLQHPAFGLRFLAATATLAMRSTVLEQPPSPPGAASGD